MPMYTHVLDVLVEDFEATAEEFTLLTGVEGIPMWEEYEPSGTTLGIHFPVGGLPALGVMAPATEATSQTSRMLTDVLARRGEGAVMLGFSLMTPLAPDGPTPDLAATVAAMRDRGVHFPSEVIRRVGDENLVTSHPICGVAAVIARHDDGHWERWDRGEFRHSSDKPPKVQTQHGVQRATVIEFVAGDLDAAAAGYAALLDEPGRTLDLGDGLRGVEFPLAGLQALRVISPTGHPVTERDRLAQRALDARGDQLTSICFEVADLDATVRELRAHGVELHELGPQPGYPDRAMVTGPRHGITFEYRSAAT